MRIKKSRLEIVMDLIPDNVRSKEDVVGYMLDHGIYIHENDKNIQSNSLVNHMNVVIGRFGNEMSDYAAHGNWYKQARHQKIHDLLCSIRALEAGGSFTIQQLTDKGE